MYIIKLPGNVIYAVFGQAKSDSQNVASRQQVITATYEKLTQAAEV